jgi:hypothetical protein
MLEEKQIKTVSALLAIERDPHAITPTGWIVAIIAGYRFYLDMILTSNGRDMRSVGVFTPIENRHRAVMQVFSSAARAVERSSIIIIIPVREIIHCLHTPLLY